MALSRVARGALVLLALGLLSACMTSKRPLFDAAAGVAALGEGGTYGSFKRQDDGSFKRDATIIVKRRGTLYDFVNEEKATTPISLHPLRAGEFIGQATSAKGEFAYVVFRVAGDEILVHVPDCDRQDKARIAALGARVERLECKLDGVADAKAFFETLDLGTAGAKLIAGK